MFNAGWEGLGVCWSECSWSHVNPTRHTIVNTTTSREVHGTQCVLVDLDCLGQCLMVSSVTLPGGMASFSTVGTGGHRECSL